MNTWLILELTPEDYEDDEDSPNSDYEDWEDLLPEDETLDDIEDEF